ncbi:MAG TPA: hypothetical protein VK666_28775, partial [Chryseolinea sp.]|nr:hypothetical protein [Chryseolinea sp.]
WMRGMYSKHRKLLDIFKYLPTRNPLDKPQQVLGTFSSVVGIRHSRTNKSNHWNVNIFDCAIADCGVLKLERPCRASGFIMSP